MLVFFKLEQSVKTWYKIWQACAFFLLYGCEPLGLAETPRDLKMAVMNTDWEAEVMKETSKKTQLQKTQHKKKIMNSSGTSEATR